MAGVRTNAILLIALLAASVAHPAAAQDLSCDRGDREVRALRFQGNREFATDILAASILTTPSSFSGLPVVGTKRCLDPVELGRDVQRLEVLYRRRGFPDVKVDTLITTVKLHVIQVTFTIREGQPMRVASLALKGLESLPDNVHVSRVPLLRVGGVFDRTALEAGRDSLVRRLRNNGWPQAEALLAYTTDGKTRTAAVEVTIVPGTRARLGRISVNAAAHSDRPRRISDATIRRTLGIRSGDWFSARAIIDAQRNLYQTDAFQRVDLQPDSLQPAGDSIVNLTATLVEGDRWVANGGVGWATLDCFRMQGALTDRDFLPKMERLELTARVSKLGIGAPLDGAPNLCQRQARNDPYSATLNYYTGLTLRQPVRVRQSYVPSITVFSSTLSEYKAFLRRTPIGGALGLANPFQSRIPSQLTYQVELGRSEAEPAYFCAVFNACDEDARTFLQRYTRLAALSYTLTRQTVDDPLRPTHGTSERLDLRHASTLIGSDVSQQFNRVVGDASWYASLGAGVTLTAHARGGVVFSGGTRPSVGGFVPPQERLYAGGPTTVRGFRQNELGPAVYIVNRYDTLSTGGTVFYRASPNAVVERVVPTGGNTLVVGNLELQVPSPIAPRLLQLAFFTDAGRLWNRGRSVFSQSLAENGPAIKVTPGLGVRVASPFGAIRVDLGYNAYALPAGAAYFNAPLQAGIAPLYCVSPTNTLAVAPQPSVVTLPPVQATGPCPQSYRPTGRSGLLRRINPSIWIGQAF